MKSKKVAEKLQMYKQNPKRLILSPKIQAEVEEACVMGTFPHA